MHSFHANCPPTEKNYYISNCELLAVVPALLSGTNRSEHPHVSAICQVQNSHQSRWALFLGCLNFSLSYSPGPNNVKADALSRMHDSSSERQDPETVLPSSCFIGATMWGIERAVLEAQREQLDPRSGPNDELFVPDSVHSQVLQWGKSSKLACHSGVHNVRKFVTTCLICSQGKSSRHCPWASCNHCPPPAWSHLSIYFVSGLRLSNGNMVILTVIDRFSKMVHFIPLPRLPSAFETLKILVNLYC